MAAAMTVDQRREANRAAWAKSGQPIFQYWLEGELAAAQAENQGLRAQIAGGQGTAAQLKTAQAEIGSLQAQAAGGQETAAQLKAAQVEIAEIRAFLNKSAGS